MRKLLTTTAIALALALPLSANAAKCNLVSANGTWITSIDSKIGFLVVAKNQYTLKTFKKGTSTVARTETGSVIVRPVKCLAELVTKSLTPMDKHDSEDNDHLPGRIPVLVFLSDIEEKTKKARFGTMSDGYISRR